MFQHNKKKRVANDTKIIEKPPYRNIEKNIEENWSFDENYIV